MSYTEEILRHYSFGSPTLLKNLADALGALEGSASAPPTKAAPGATPDPLKSGAMASEGSRTFAASDALLDSLNVPATTILAALSENAARNENLAPAAARQLAEQRHPKVTARYLAEGRDLRPDEELAQRAKTRVARDGIDYGRALGLELAENPDLAARYKSDNFGESAAEAQGIVKPPPGQRLITERPDMQLAARVKARQKRDGLDWREAQRLVLSEDPALASRYADQKAGRTALSELRYRAETIQAAARGRDRRTTSRAVSAALAEDPQLRAGVDAYFEKAT